VCGEPISHREALGLAVGSIFKLADEHIFQLNVKNLNPAQLANAMEWIHRECLDPYIDAKFVDLAAKAAQQKKKKPKMPPGKRLLNPLGEEIELPEDEEEDDAGQPD
jgi:hypothetical protein